MREAPFPLWTNVALPASGGPVVTTPVLLENIFGFSIQIVWTGTPVGVFTIQGSNDLGFKNLQTGAVTGVTNWTPLTSGTISAAGSAANGMFNDVGAYFRWVQISYAPTSGTGTASANMQIKGL